jgi:hypothetical protein
MNSTSAQVAAEELDLLKALDLTVLDAGEDLPLEGIVFVRSLGY